MKPILKKALIVSTAILVPAAAIGIGCGVYFSSHGVERISQKGIFSMRYNENLNNEGYKYDYSATYGSPTSSNSATSNLSMLVLNEILHIRTEGKFEFDQKTGEVIQPSYESFEFANANSLVLTFVDTSLNESQLNPDYLKTQPDKYFQLVFNSDDASITPTPDNKQQKVLDKDSDDPRSINNSKVFGKIIASGFLGSKPNLDDPNISIDTTNKKFILAGLGVTFAPGNKWVDSNGHQTKYDICPKDMFYSFKRTWLYDKTYRRSHGGSQDLDSYFISKTQTTKRFGETQKYPNAYIFDFLNINEDKLENEDTAVQKTVDGQDAFTFSMNIFSKDGSINLDSSFSIRNIIKQYLVNDLTFSLAPSQYIDEVFNNQKNNYTSAGEITGEAAKYGIYTYGQDREHTLYASCYIPTYSEANREIFEYNKYYANKNWVESVQKGKVVNGKKQRTLNKVIIEYTGSIDSSTFINQAFTSYLNGTLSQVDYSLISDAQKQKLYGSSNDENVLISNSEKNGLQPTKKINVSQLTSRMVWQANPINNSSYSFNDVYSQLVYGSTIQQLNKGVANTGNSFFAGYGFDFRLLIQASINWQQYIQQAYSGTRDVWLSGAAQNAVFCSTSANSLTPADFIDQGINDLIYFDENGNKQVVTFKEMKELSAMTAEQIKDKYGEAAAQNFQKTKMQSPQYQQIKKAMKILLDKFYQEYNLDSSKNKIEFEIAYPFADQDEVKCSATKYIVENVINELDPRINAKFLKPTTRNEMLTSINQRRGAFNANLWSYDYEGIGSYFAAFTSTGGGTNIVNAYGIFAKDPDNDPDELFQNQVVEGITIIRPSRGKVRSLQQQFPQFTELAKYVREHFDSDLADGAQSYDEMLKVENWDLINNYQNNNIIQYFTQKLDGDQWVADLDRNPNQLNPIAELPVIYKKFESDASWQQSSSYEEQGKGWVGLIKEFDSIKGVSIDTESSVDRIESVNYTLYLSEYIVPLSKYGLQYFEDIKYEVEA